MITRLGPASRVTLLVLALLLAVAGGATAKGTYDAKRAKNSDKVDGKHAVAAKVSPARRKGKLVATDPQTGLLPSDIVGTVAEAKRATQADDATALGGVPAAALRTVTFPVTSAGVQGGATVLGDSAALAPSGDSTLSWSMLLPADRNPADPVLVDLLYAETSAAACSWFRSTGGVAEYFSGFSNYSWYPLDSQTVSGPITVPAGAGDAHRVSFRYSAPDLRPGELVTFTVTRQGGNAADTCLAVAFHGIQFRY